MGLPVICSSATVLPEVANGAALLVDPDSPEQMAEMMERVIVDQELCSELTKRGEAVLIDYSADKAAMQFRDLYALTAWSHGND